MLQVFHFLSLNFTWTPINPKKNAILAILFSFEYSCDEPSFSLWEEGNSVNWQLFSGVDIFKYNFWPDHLGKSARNLAEWNQSWASEWEIVTFQTTLDSEPNTFITQNQEQYPIKLGFGHNGIVSTYIRNVNLILLVIDG